MKKLIKLTLLISFYILSYLPICAIEEGVYFIFQNSGDKQWCNKHTPYSQHHLISSHSYLTASGAEGVSAHLQCLPAFESSRRDQLWSIELFKDGDYRICSNIKNVGIRCLEAFPSMEGKSLVKLSPPSSHQHQLWSIKPFHGPNGQGGYTICSNTVYLGLRCLGTTDGYDGATRAIKAEEYQPWQFEETYYRITNLEKSDKQQNFRLTALEQQNARLAALESKLDELTAADELQLNVRLTALEEQNIRFATQESKLDELKGTGEPQANDFINLDNRLRNLEKFNEQISVFTSSFISGATYTLFPEVIKDGIEYSGYPKAANVATVIMQGGMIAYNTTSYASTITGLAVRSGTNFFGFSDQASVIAGSMAAIVATVSQRLLNEEEVTFDYISGLSLAVAGGYAGSTLALQAKSWIYEYWNKQGISLSSQAASWVAQGPSWVYGFWGNNGKASKAKPDTSIVSTLQKTISEKDQRIKELESTLALLKENKV